MVIWNVPGDIEFAKILRKVHWWGIRVALELWKCETRKYARTQNARMNKRKDIPRGRALTRHIVWDACEAWKRGDHSMWVKMLLTHFKKLFLKHTDFLRKT